MGQRGRITSSNGAMVRLNVFEQQDSEIWGEISNIYCEKAISCTDVGDFLLKLDALYENLKCPMAEMHVRSFLEYRKPILHDGPPTAEPTAYFDSNRFNLYQQLRKEKQNNVVTGISQKNYIKPIEVFFINTIFRHHTSLQGEVLWEKTGQKICYRSALELLHLIQSVLQESGPNDDPYSTAQIKYWLKEG